MNSFLPCSLFHCLQLVIPNLYHLLQALASPLLPSFSAENCQEKNRLKPRIPSTAFFMYIASILPPFPPVVYKLYQFCIFSKAIPSSVNSNAALHISPKPMNHIFSTSFITFSLLLQSLLFPFCLGHMLKTLPNLNKEQILFH